MSQFRNSMATKSGSILPTEYLRLKALQVNSGQYIDTELVISSIEPLTIDYVKLPNSDACLLSAGSTDPQIIVLKIATALFVKWYASGSAPSYAINAEKEYHILLYGENDYYINNDKFQNLPTPVVGLPNTPLFIFKRANQSSYNFIGQCGRISLGTLADFIPVQRNDGVCGYYDIIGKRFHTSADGTNFTPIYMD